MINQLVQVPSINYFAKLFLISFFSPGFVSAQNAKNYVRYQQSKSNKTTTTTMKGSNNYTQLLYNNSLNDNKLLSSKTKGSDQQQLQKNSIGPLIVGGTPAIRGEFPSFATGEGCGATLIYPDILLSAAHCPEFVWAYGVYIGGGTIYQDLKSGYEFFEVIRSVIHPDYSIDDTGAYNDIRIIKLANSSTAPLQQLNFDDSIPYENEPVTAIGHGTTSTGGTEPSNQLLKVTIPVVPNDKCSSAYEGYFTIKPEAHLCASEVGKDTCQGDSGGPLFSTSTTTNVQVGITSFGGIPPDFSCGDPSFPGVYTRVSTYKDFIQKQICNLSANPPEDCAKDVTVRVQGYFFAFNAYGVNYPSKNDYNDMASSLDEYFKDVVQNKYSNLKSVRSSIDFTAFENPDYPRNGGDYNIYMEFKHADYKFESSSNNNDVPSSSEIIQAISNAINRKFIVNVVRRVGEPFTDVTDVLFGELDAKPRTYQAAHADKN